MLCKHSGVFVLSEPLLFQPLDIRGVTLPNRVVVAPMCQYSAEGGYPTAHHTVHYGQFALGGAGLVIIEATGVTSDGRITNGCLGLWEDGQADALRPIAQFLKNNGSIPAIQLAHAGRKSAMQRPWHGNGPQTEEDQARGDDIWEPSAPSAIALDDGWLAPKAMTAQDLKDVRDAFAAAAVRAMNAGFEVVEVHMAHGYLLHSFLSPISNHREDEYGGNLEGRMQFPFSVIDAVRDVLPGDFPLFVRISAVDGIEDGWTLDDSVLFARALKARGVDVIDCSSGGNTAKPTALGPKRGPGFQAPFAARIKAEADIKTQAVGLIRTPQLAEELLQNGSADLIALGRQLLYNPSWPAHAAEQFGAAGNFDDWPQQYGWWLERWDKSLQAMGETAQPQIGDHYLNSRN
ncbi:MAG: NADH:flavin oxidoreductase/NADH oxidase [Sneathiella sp.]|nr:NADH:flavin oxidoreductase/NADH oxidase [Sneathiella sp.]